MRSTRLAMHRDLIQRIQDLKEADSAAYDSMTSDAAVLARGQFGLRGQNTWALVGQKELADLLAACRRLLNPEDNQ